MFAWMRARARWIVYAVLCAWGATSASIVQRAWATDCSGQCAWDCVDGYCTLTSSSCTCACEEQCPGCGPAAASELPLGTGQVLGGCGGASAVPGVCQCEWIVVECAPAGAFKCLQFVEKWENGVPVGSSAGCHMPVTPEGATVGQVIFASCAGDPPPCGYCVLNSNVVTTDPLTFEWSVAASYCAPACECQLPSTPPPNGDSVTIVCGEGECAGHGGDTDGDGVCDDTDCYDSDPTKWECDPCPGGNADGDACCDADDEFPHDPSRGCADPTCPGMSVDNDGDGVCSYYDCDDNDPLERDLVGHCCESEGGDADGDGCCDDGDKDPTDPAVCDDRCPDTIRICTVTIPPEEEGGESLVVTCDPDYHDPADGPCICTETQDADSDGDGCCDSKEPGHEGDPNVNGCCGCNVWDVLTDGATRWYLVQAELDERLKPIEIDGETEAVWAERFELDLSIPLYGTSSTLDFEVEVPVSIERVRTLVVGIGGNSGTWASIVSAFNVFRVSMRAIFGVFLSMLAVKILLSEIKV